MVTIEDFKKLELRIAEIISAAPHPQADRLLVLRIKACESGMFEAVKNKSVKRGSFGLIFKSLPNILRYLCCILIGIPLWFVIGILVTFSPEFGKALG